MKIYWRAKPTIFCGVLALGMLRLAWWQWERHLEKQVFVAMMEQRLAAAPEPVTALVTPLLTPETGNPSSENSAWEKLNYRRALVKGRYDFENEIVLRNRRLDGAPGVYVITPLKLDGIDSALLVTRGFVPLSVSQPDKRKDFRGSSETEFVALLKTTTPRKMFAPQDPQTGPGLPRIDQWLRVDPTAVEKQLPYPLLPIYAEIMSSVSPQAAEKEIVRTEKGREELLFLGFREQNVGLPDVRPGLVYPVPVYDAVIPPGRHYGYVYEWSFMAISTILIGLVIQLRPPKFPGSNKQS